MDNGMKMPLGKLVDRELEKKSLQNNKNENRRLLSEFNEYVVYREDQSKIRYIVEIKL